ncbi:PARP1-binding protein [Chelonia mydas]|uniref:PCNA-interacting partner n=1 Tax=Chelonia mydas TaxID=8469 RepID=M7B6S3_CHEMY|nr:PARP1-binding protein [Chelonia mydas]
MEAPENYDDIKKAYDTFLKRSNMLDLIDICQKCHTLTSESEIEEMSPVQLLKFISGLSEENGSSLSIPSTPIRHSQDNVKLLLIVKKFVYAYLSLLVNSKNDLAVAHVLNIPDRGLGREAFTDLKHAAQNRQMSIFLMATSFIRMIELGGKGYAPSPFDTLRTHVKGLSEFVNFIDKLEEIIGEVLDPRIAGGRILSTIKIHLIKGRNSGDPFCRAAEEVLRDLDLRIKNIINSQHEAVTASTTGISPARPKLHAINHGTAYCGRETVKALLALLDEEAANLPTKNKAELLYGDENVTPFGITSVLTLFRSPAQSTRSSPKPLRQRIKTSVGERKIKVGCSSNQQAIVSRYCYNTCGAMAKFAEVLLQDSRAEFSAFIDNGKLIFRASLQAALDELMATGVMATGVAMRRGAWLQVSGLPYKMQQIIQGLTFEGVTLFSEKTDKRLHSLKDSRATLKSLGLHTLGMQRRHFRLQPLPRFFQQQNQQDGSRRRNRSGRKRLHLSSGQGSGQSKPPSGPKQAF